MAYLKALVLDGVRFREAGPADVLLDGAGNPLPVAVALSADQTFSAVTLADVVGLSFAVTTGMKARFRFGVAFRSANTGVGIGLSVSCPAFTVLAATVQIPVAADGTGGAYHGWITASNDMVVGTNVQAANTDYLATIEGILVPSASGVLQVRARSETAGTVVTVRTGSFGILHTV